MFISREQMLALIKRAKSGSISAIAHIEAIASLRKKDNARDNMFINMARLAIEKI